MICDKHKIIFIHIPKCAGSSIEKIFNRPQRDHSTALQIKLKHQDKWNSYFKFTIVRNTWERLVSIYHFRKKEKRLVEHLKNKNHNDCFNFEKWLKSIIFSNSHHARNNLLLHPGIQSQMDYFLIDGKNYMDQIFDLKEIHLVENFLQKFNLKMIQINRSDHEHYSFYYTKELVDLVYQRFESEIKYFNFNYESKYFKIF